MTELFCVEPQLHVLGQSFQDAFLDMSAVEVLLVLAEEPHL